MNKNWLGISTLTVILMLSGCNNKEQSNKPKEPNEIEVSQNVENKQEEYSHYFPLTGIGSKEEVNNRSVAVMINNHPKARPQSGLHKADIVYELLAEGDVTRFLAIFQSELPETVGPVRSARDYYIEIAKGYNSLYICHGYSPEAKEMLDHGYIDSLNGLFYDGTLFNRANFRKAPHNSYISFENIRKGAEQNKFDMEQPTVELSFLTKEDIESINGEQTDSAMISYLGNDLFTVFYEYDYSREKYIRFSNSEQTVDLDTKEEVLLDNILIIEADHRIVDSQGRRDIDIMSGGRGYLLQKGKRMEVEWKNDQGRILPFRDGSQVPFVPGKTWVNVVPSDPGMGEVVSFDSQ